jgi:hypothetical protein
MDKTITCYVCGKNGHIAADCTKKQWISECNTCKATFFNSEQSLLHKNTCSMRKKLNKKKLLKMKDAIKQSDVIKNNTMIYLNFIYRYFNDCHSTNTLNTTMTSKDLQEIYEKVFDNQHKKLTDSQKIEDAEMFRKFIIYFTNGVRDILDIMGYRDGLPFSW